MPWLSRSCRRVDPANVCCPSEPGRQPDMLNADIEFARMAVYFWIHISIEIPGLTVEFTLRVKLIEPSSLASLTKASKT